VSTRQKIAVIGSGISGLAAAWSIRTLHDVTLFEANDYFGGHSNTVDVTIDGVTAPVDTGFLVHNDLTYPNLVALFKHLNIDTHESAMTFSVNIASDDIEWAGSSLDTVFAQRRNLLRPRFWAMLYDILRFNRNAVAYLATIPSSNYTLRELLVQHGYNQAMQEWYLLPMAAAIWSSSTIDILDFPAATFLRFCLNHHLLQVNHRPPWKTVLNGSRHYVAAMLKDLQDIRRNSPVTKVVRSKERVLVSTHTKTEVFDQVIFACHAPTTLKILDCNALERRLLGAFRTQPNQAILHTDTAFLPKNCKTWSAWNYTMPHNHHPQHPVTVTYLLNHLQPLPWQQPVMVTLNPYQAVSADHMIASFNYDHPIMDSRAINAQQQIPLIQGQRRAWFCGAWAGYGFHEDGLKSGLRVAMALGATPPWGEIYA